jgi:hypothetical protein
MLRDETSLGRIITPPHFVMKGSVQQKLSWVKSGVYWWIRASDCGARCYFVILVGRFLLYSVFPFMYVSTAQFIGEFWYNRWCGTSIVKILSPQLTPLFKIGVHRPCPASFTVAWISLDYSFRLHIRKVAIPTFKDQLSGVKTTPLSRKSQLYEICNIWLAMILSLRRTYKTSPYKTSPRLNVY